jgi:cytochrome c
MSSLRKALLALTLTLPVSSALAETPAYPGIGRAATAGEVTAWNIDVRPDFTGLPAGSGTVAAGQVVWESKCAACHGYFGESNKVAGPVAGGVTPEDVRTGRVARLKDAAYPVRTTLMKVATLSTLWDYIRRAMPWDAPKSLTVDEVYSATAYVLHLGGVVPATFTLSDKTMAEAQSQMPNRNGMSTRHALWPGDELGGATPPDTRNTACMKDCGPVPRITSTLPDHARNDHGNLARQNRLVGPQRGVDTTR